MNTQPTIFTLPMQDGTTRTQTGKAVLDEQNQPTGIGYTQENALLAEVFSPFHSGSGFRIAPRPFHDEQKLLAFCEQATALADFTTPTYEALLKSYQERHPGATYKALAQDLTQLQEALEDVHPFISVIREDCAAASDPASADDPHLQEMQAILPRLMDEEADEMCL